MSYGRSSRYHTQGPSFSSNGKAPLWPKLLGLLIVTVMALGVGVYLGSGQSPADWIDGLRPASTQEPTVALAPAAQSADQTETSADAGPTNGGAAPDSGVSLTVANPEQTKEPAPTEESQPSTDPASAQDAAFAFSEAWVKGDYGAMYDLLAAETQSELSREEFINRYLGIVQEAGIFDVAVTLTGEQTSTDEVPVRVELQTTKVGTISQDNQIQTRAEDGTWKVVWSPSTIIAGLDDGCIDFTQQSAKRGSIVDRNGELLAYDGIVNEIGIIPGKLENETQTIAALSKLIGMKTTDIKARYKDAEPEWFIPITEVPDPLDTEILNGISNMAGVAVREKTSRIYPLGPVAAHITGYVTPVNAEDLEADTNGNLVAGEMLGRAGLEAAANDILAGNPGGRLSIVSCTTRVEQEVIASAPGQAPQDIVLTIDANFQKQVDAALGNVTGSAVVIEPETGAIMAMVSHPTFDPNLFVKGLTDKQAADIFDETARPLINRATQQGYPTGSIFKVITMAAGMEYLGYDGGSEIYCPTEWSIPGTQQIWRDWTSEYGGGDQGLLNLHTALVNSCNTVFYQLGYELDREDQTLLPGMAKAFGLGSPTGIPYIQETGGTVPDPDWKVAAVNDYWATGDAINLSIGQGFLEATPLQMANVYATIANGGYLLQPYIVSSFFDPLAQTTTEVGTRTEIARVPVSDADIAEIQSALRDQTSNSWGAGSVTVFGDFTWPIAGKTGTAQNQSNLAQKPHSWFAAFGPYGDTPEITSIVMVESSGEGVSYAAPITRTIYEKWLAAA